MTPSRPGKATLVTLARDQVASILIDLGLEDVDIRTFWRAALREQRDPGCTRRETQQYWDRVLSLEGEG